MFERIEHDGQEIPFKMKTASFQAASEQLLSIAGQYTACFDVVIRGKKVRQALRLRNFSVQHDYTTCCVGKEWCKLELFTGYMPNCIEQLGEELREGLTRFFIAVQACKCKS